MTATAIYSLTKTTQFRLRLFPKDYYKAKSFYENDLNYPIIHSWDQENNKGAMFNTGVGILELNTPEEKYEPLQGANASFRVDDVWTLWEKLKNHPNIVKPLTLRPWGDVSFRIVDPEGFQISFFTPNSEKP